MTTKTRKKTRQATGRRFGSNDEGFVPTAGKREKILNRPIKRVTSKSSGRSVQASTQSGKRRSFEEREFKNRKKE